MMIFTVTATLATTGQSLRIENIEIFMSLKPATQLFIVYRSIRSHIASTYYQ